MEEWMKSLTLVIVLAALIITGSGFIHNGALAGQGKKVNSIEITYSVDRVKPPSPLAKLFRVQCTSKPGITCTASSPGEYAKVAYTVASALHKSYRTAALSSVKFAAKTTSRFIRNMVLLGKIITSI
jgi:hypothetical protein